MYYRENQAKYNLKDRKQKIKEKELADLVEGMRSFRRGKYQIQDQEPEDFIDKKANRWWARFDDRYFRVVPKGQVIDLRDITTSSLILEELDRQKFKTPDSYLYERILPAYNLFWQETLIHVLFKSSTPFFSCLVSYEVQFGETELSEEQTSLKKQIDEKSRIRVTKTRTITKQVNQDKTQINLNLIGFNQDLQCCLLTQNYKNWCLNSHKTQIETQLELWQQELVIVDAQNNVQWNQLFSNLKKQNIKPQDHSQEINYIRQQLMWVTILQYFQQGFKDKTTTMLKSLIDSQKLLRPTKGHHLKKFFETDCKICFCSNNNDSNQVLYCDQCNTSYHLACYGLDSIPPEDKYYCDTCKQERQIKDCKKICCQLCCKTRYPMKKINDHFYHVTCLMLFNCINLQQSKFALRKELSYQKIQEMVIKNQINNKQCIFCTSGSDQGIRLCCAVQGCEQLSHPICAYINGCRFEIQKNLKTKRLEVQFYCNDHDQTRNTIQQIYLRRYMCNYKDASSLQLPQFQNKYQKQVSSRNLKIKDKKVFSSSQKIITKTRIVKKFLQKMKEERNNNQDKGKEATQTRKMLQDRMKKKV